MPMIEILVYQPDLDAAIRIAKKMFPPEVNRLTAEDVIAKAVMVGMELLCKEWNEADAPTDWGTAKEVK